VPKTSGRFGTLVGNWSEEHVLRSTIGEARSIPQRHVKRSGLLVDFTRKPSQPRILDDTFERVSGSKVTEAPNRFLTTNEDRKADTSVKPETVKPRESLATAELVSIALTNVKDTEEAVSSGLNQRYFDTTYASTFLPLTDARPVRSFPKKATQWQPRESVEVQSRPCKDIPYHLSPALTFDAEQRSGDFRKFCEFSHPLELASRGDRFKDESGARPEKPNLPAGSLDTLPGLRKSLRDIININSLRERLTAESGFVKVEAVRVVIAELCPGWPSLDKYVSYLSSQLSTMQKGMIRLADLIRDLTPL